MSRRTALLIYSLFCIFQSKVLARVSSRSALHRRNIASNLLLDYGPDVLRRMAVHRLPVHARRVARPHFHLQLHCRRALSLLQRHRRESRTETAAQVLASKRFRIRNSIHNDETFT